MLITKDIVATNISSALALRHLFAFALLLFTLLPITTTTANSIPLKKSLANANTANVPDNLKADHRAVRADILMRGQAVIDAVPVAERTAFIRYELAKAMNNFNFTANNKNTTNHARAINPRFSLGTTNSFNPPQLQLFENIPSYTDFADDLMYWLRDRFQLAEENILDFIAPRSNILCSADGVCYTEEEIAANCCPF